LTPAAKNNWLLSCHECTRQDEFNIESDLCGEKALLLWIFYPNLYRKLNGKNQHGRFNTVLDKLHDISQRGQFIVRWT
jgi:hypothetical protein